MKNKSDSSAISLGVSYVVNKENIINIGHIIRTNCL
jgi:hypothetical protein